MPSLPASIIFLLQPFAALFGARTWRKAQVLLVGAILAPGKRTVSSALQVLGLQEQRDFARYHHVLSRAVWSSLAVSRVLLSLLLRHLAPATGPLVLGIDETVERRKGKRIAAKGVYRDGVRSSHGHFVKAMGLRWISLMWLVEIPWARRVWALPFLTVLAPSTRYHAERGCRHKTVTDWARQMLCCVRRWLPAQELVVVGDRGYAALRLLAACQRMTPALTFLTRLRLDAALYAPAPVRAPGQTGRPRLKGVRLPSLHTVLTDPATAWTPLRQRWSDGTVRQLEYASDTAVWYHGGHPPVPIRWLLIRDPAQPQEPQALLSTDPALAPPQILTLYLRRWSMEVTLSGRAHLPGRGNPAAVVGPGHPAHHPGPAGPLQLAGAGHPCPAKGPARRPPAFGLVCQAGPHLLRCAGLHAPHALARVPPFSQVAVPDRPPKTCAASAAHDYGCTLLHRVIVQSRAQTMHNYRLATYVKALRKEVQTLSSE